MITEPQLHGYDVSATATKKRNKQQQQLQQQINHLFTCLIDKIYNFYTYIYTLTAYK